MNRSWVGLEREPFLPRRRNKRRDPTQREFFAPSEMHPAPEIETKPDLGGCWSKGCNSHASHISNGKASCSLHPYLGI